MKTLRINTTIKRFSLAVIFVSSAVISGTAIARADGILTPYEEQFGDGIAPALCDYIDVAGVNYASMYQAIKIIYNRTPANIDAGDAADIINYAVSTYCPRHWKELVAFGEGAKSHA